MHFLGPNCIGVVNSYENLNTTYFPYEAQPGYVGMASQSGSYVTQMFGCLAGLGLGFSQALSVGNEAMIDITDCLQYLGNCPRTRVIVLYIEAIRRGRQFFRVAMNVGKSKPIIAVYVGGSSAGRQAALSHTGAMAGPDRLYDGMFKQAGIIRAQSILHAFQWCVVLGAQPLPRGQRVGILTHSGGPGASAADAAERHGLEPATFSPDTRQRLLDIVPHTASVENPVDLTFNRDPNEYSKVLPGILLDDPGVDSLFMYLLMPAARVKQAALALGQDPAAAEDAAQEFLKQQASAIADLASRYDKPVVGASFSPITDLSVQILREAGVSVLPSPEAAMEALAALSRYARFRRRLASREYEDHAECLGQSGPRAGRGAGAGPDV
jgi:acyl-CoA synthetase (NDP forming)